MTENWVLFPRLFFFFLEKHFILSKCKRIKLCYRTTWLHTKETMKKATGHIISKYSESHNSYMLFLLVLTYMYMNNAVVMLKQLRLREKKAVVFKFLTKSFVTQLFFSCLMFLITVIKWEVLHVPLLLVLDTEICR